MKKIFASMLVMGALILSPTFAFSDVPVNFWAYDKISQMYKSGIVSGFEDETFRPNDTITREQSATILSNFFELSKNDDEKIFDDVQDGRWSFEYIQLVSKYMPIDEENGRYYFRPEDFATRIEIAKAVSNIIGLDADETDLTIINSFSDKDQFSEGDEKYIALVANNKIMVGDDKLEFRPNSTITRAEFCALIYNIYLMKNDIKEQEIDRTVMTVNGESITVKEFNMYFELQKKVYEAMFGGSDIWEEKIDGLTLYEIVKEATKDGIIATRVKIQNANKLGIELSEEVKNEIEVYANGEEGTEICEFYGITPKQLCNINSDGMLIYELARYMYDNSDHTGHLHLDIYDKVDTLRYDARHILLVTEGLEDEDKAKVKETAYSLLERVKNGEDFAILANTYSQDAGSNQNGGLYENIELGKFVTEFEEAALAMSDGEIYPELVESSFGYHIIKLEKKVNTQRELTDDEKQEIMSAELEEISQEWIDDAIVEVNEDIYVTL